MRTIKEHLTAKANGERMSNTIHHALSEFVFAGWMTQDGVFNDESQESICQDMIQVIELIDGQDHSGFSIQYLITHLPPLLKQEPVAPLTGEADEWMQLQDDLYMNKRCHRVVKYGENEPSYDTEGVVHYEKTIDSDGKESRSYFIEKPTTPITFPYTPTTVYVEASQEEADLG